MFDIGGIIKGAGDIIGKFKASPEEKMAATQALHDLERQATKDLLDYELGTMKEQASIIRAEAESNSWLAQSWRPIVMLTLTAALVAKYVFGVGPTMPTEVTLQMIQLVTMGLGGYIVGRTAEKIIPRSKWGKQ